MTQLAHGRVIIAVQDALSRADFRSEQERDEFCDYLVKHSHEKIRQSILTWRANRVPDSELTRTQAIDRERRKAPPVL